MKKVLVICSAILSLIACSKASAPVEEKSFMTLGAAIEQPTEANVTTPANVSTPDVKATLNNSLNTIWAEGDVIKVNVANQANDWSTDEDLTLYSGDGTANGMFRSATLYADGDHWDNYAFFPYYYTGSSGSTNTGTNMGGDGFYFFLPESYYSYTSGQSFLPLLADMSGGDTHPTSISFKHVGGAVVVNLTGVPGAAKSLGINVDGLNIHGWLGKVLVSEAGTSSGKLTASNGSDSSVWLNFATAAANRDFKFIFPVPTISGTSNITFTMYDSNDLMIWRKTASSQPAIGRAEALVMPEKAVVAIPQNMYLVGYWGDADQDVGEAFSNSTGKLTITFSGDAYVCLRAADTGNWYMTDNYVSSGNSATVKAQSGDKLYVPAGTWEFTMSYQTDGSIVISYAAAS